MNLQTTHRFGRNPVGLVWAAAVLAAALLWPALTYGGGVVTTATEAALNSALNGGGTVTFACNGVINLTGTKTISANTVLDATGYGVTLSGQSSVQLFAVNSGVSLTLVNLTLANGKASNGGAIYNSGTLMANYCTFTNNTVLGANGTAGAAGADNSSGDGGAGGSGTAGASALGGAIYNSGTLSLLSCVFQSNSVAGGTGGAGGRGGSGHGTFSYGGNGGSGAAGGSAQGGAVYSTGTLLVSNCYVYANSAAGGSGGAGGAGGTATGTASVPGLLGAGGLGAEGSGAGIYCAQAITVLSSTFYGNGGRGGNTAAAAGTAEKNGLTGGAGGSSFGGGIRTIGGVLTNCTFSWNSVGGGSGGNGGAGTGSLNRGGNGGTGGTGAGGGLYTSASLWVVNCTFTLCSASGGAGGLGASGAFQGSNGSTGVAQGGDIDNGGGTFTLKNSIVAYSQNGGNGYGTITDAGNNISSDTSVTLNGAGSYNNTDPLLSTLAANGGFTPTCAIAANSVAVNHGDDTVAPVVDQRDYVRSGTSDIGAYEYGGVARDYTTVEIFATNGMAVEGSSVSAFIIYRDTYAANTPAKAVYYSISGTASNGVDYVALSNSCVIPGGHYAVTNVLTPIFHSTLGGTKTVTLTLQTNISYGVGSYSNATIGLLDNSPTITVVASSAYAWGTAQPGMFVIGRSGGALSNSVTVNYAISGTAQAGSYSGVPASVILAPNQMGTNLTVTETASPSAAQTVVLTLSTNANYLLGADSQAVVTLLPQSDTTNSVPSPVGRYRRGTGSNPAYWSIVVPLNYERGTNYDNISGNCAALYPGLASWTNAALYHYNATNGLPQTNSATRIAFNNPIVAFGERVGGTPLYPNQYYSFGIYAGNPLPGPQPVSILVFSRSNFALVGAVNLAPPNSRDPSSWTNYVNSAFRATTNAFGLMTALSDTPSLTWGTTNRGAWVLTHEASDLATNYYYLVQASGYVDGQSNAMAISSGGAIAPSLLYTLEFAQRPQFRSVFLDQPHFDGKPLPPFYAGKTVAEMLTNTPPVTNAVTLSPSSCTNLNDSPELRRHPVLDQFVADMGNDPVALANYVLNEIDLTDAMDYNDNGSVSEESINQGGVSRGALGVFMEKQGSPTEQCALLIYLLRQAGVPAAYVYPPHNGMQILDARLSRMLKFQVHGGFSEAGQLYTANTMIAVNYPWVAAYIGSKWVHIFPWLKDYSISEGLDLYAYMPSNYPSAYPWVRDYVYGVTNLLSLAVDGDNTPRVIFPRFLAQTLQQNHPGVSVDDIGVQIVNRRHYFPRWQDFPTPTCLTNTSIAVTNLTDSAITSVSPLLTNIFDTLSVEVYSLTDPTKDIKTGDLRLVDLHNRQFYLTQSNASPAQVQLSLILAPFSTNIASQAAFINDSNLLSKEVLTLMLDQYDYSLSIRLKYYRHHAITPSYPIDPTRTFLGLGAGNQIVVERPLQKGDVAALCLNYGRVTRDMVNAHAQDLWQMQSALRANPLLTNSLSPDVYQGALMTIAGMQYYQKTSDFDAVNQRLHKVNALSTWAMGLSKISPRLDVYGNLAGGGVDPILPNVDMMFYEMASVGNGTLCPDSGQTLETAGQSYNMLSTADGSAEEHQVINSFYQQTNAVSTVRLLQLAQSRGLGIVQLNYTNYVALGQAPYQGHPLQSYDAGLWSSIVAAFQGSDGKYVTAYVTPGPITNSAYEGMGALIFGWSQWQALITPGGMNGAFGENFGNYSVSPWGANGWQLTGGDQMSANVVPSTGVTLPPSQTTGGNALYVYNQAQNNNFVLDPFTQAWMASVNNVAGASQTYGSTFLSTWQSGYNGSPNDAGSQLGVRSGDPVNNISGEFYVEETDLQLPGPIPLALRRNYSSQNLADNQFGPGWKLSIMPYLSVGAGGTNIYAADMDGAVLAYVRTATNASVWLPTTAANPQLNNNTTAGVGGLANRLRDRLVQSVGSTTNYTLYGADGSVRAFQVMTFNNGILSQTRPYLLQWTDNRGNYYAFTYGTDSTQPDFGQVRRIQCSNGNSLGFHFDVYGHIIEAYSGDGRRLFYDFDEFGDLVAVTLPDESTREYVYQHGTQAVTNGAVVTQQPYSTHLIVEEDRPDGRALVNVYDGQRRVTNQLSTAGSDLTPVRTATFVYANNFNLTNSYTNTISGYTVAIDGNNHTNRYDYTNGLITQITDPLGQTIQQTWYADNATAPGYPRSVSVRKDKRGLLTQFFYDSNGNVTNGIVTGDLTGDGIATQTATNSAVYNTNCLPVQTVDPAGNGTVLVYDSTFAFLPQQIIRYAGTTPVSINFTLYGNVTNVFAQGSSMQTNLARGLALRNVRAYGAPDAATTDVAYDGHGFPTQTVRYTGTSDPAVTNSFFYNERGQMVDQLDGVGALTHFEYDAMDRPTEQWNVDEGGALLSWKFNYYNDNGELTWSDGPAYNPEDYVWRDYDGAGRLSTEIHWRAEAKADGGGVQAPAGYNLYAQTFYSFDVLGNLKRSVNPRGVVVTNTWDALNRLVTRSVIDTNGTVLASESIGYEPGGLEHFHTNALGGFTQTEYTTNGLPKYRLNADGSTNGWRYYLDGRVRREIQRNGAYWETLYDDANRKATRVFHSAAGAALATNVTVLDRRGNVAQRVDAAYNVFTNLFDGLDRLRVATGPATTTVSQNCGTAPPGCGIYVTNVLQQMTTRIYDAANRVLIVSNAIGEKTVTTSDMLGRVLSQQTFAAGAATPLRVTTTAYSADHHGVTVTDGSGAGAIVSTAFSDNDGRRLLTVGYPSTGAREYTLNQYDLAGNLIHEEHDSATNSAVTLWSNADYVFDGLNRLVRKSDRDGAVTTFAYDPANNPTNRLMPGGLQWSASYNNAGQELQDWVTGTNGTTTMANSFTYYPSGNAAAGLLQTKTEGRGVTATHTYDNWLRLINIVCSMGSPAGQLTTTWAYDARGLATNITEMNAGDSAGSDAKVVSRTFDGYGQLASESITLNGAPMSSASQGWDVAGRRTLLSLSSQAASMTCGYGWRADGSLGSVGTPVGAASYAYSATGLLDTRTVGSRVTSVTSRDGMGRPLAINTTVNTQQKLVETLTWTGDGLLGTHLLAREDFTDERDYAYASLSRRLIEERVNLGAATRWTNDFVYDGGAGSGLGVLTYAGAPSAGAASWTAGVNAFLWVATETNTVSRQSAYGRFNGQATVSATLDGHPLPMSFSTTTNYAWTNRWQTTMELPPGAHQLAVSALHPSGLFTTNASVWFTNNLARETDQIRREGAGNILQRTWKNPGGTTTHSQFLTFDAKLRLCGMWDDDNQRNGFLWLAEYDGLDRLLCTKWYAETNGWAQISGVIAQTNAFVYDPQVQFLDMGVYIGPSGRDSMPGQMTWKLCGPDLNGRYGGLNGTGGLEAVATGSGYFAPTINDARGNVLGVSEPAHGTVAWNASRPTGYGAVPGYRPLPLGHGGSYAQSAAWRGKWADVTGYVWLGARFYDPVAGMFISPDPVWNSQDPGYWSYCGGDPINGFDANGLCGNPAWENDPSIPVLRAADPNSGYGSIRARDVVGGFVDELHGNLISMAGPWSLDQLGANAAGATTFESQYYNGLGQQFRDVYGNLSAKTGFSEPNSSGSAIGSMGADAFTMYQILNGARQQTGGEPAPAPRQPLLLTEGSLESRVTTAYQNFYNQAWQEVVNDFNQGGTKVPAGQSWQTVLGQRTDAAARDMLNDYLNAQGIPEGPGGQVLVNRRLYDPSSSGAYRIPDVRIPSANLILDGTVGTKTPATPQVQDFMNWGNNRVNIVSPTVLPGF
jgi:RHS repeat-associated protein